MKPKDRENILKIYLVNTVALLSVVVAGSVALMVALGGLLR